MKKFITGILAILYIVMVSGISLEKHYCMGKLAGIEFYGSESDKCGRCGMTEKNNACCHDEHSFVKVDDTHKTVNNDISFVSPIIEFTPIQLYSTTILTVTDEVVLPTSFYPPDDTGPSVCILNCVFRI